jgi:hypothetical protein
MKAVLLYSYGDPSQLRYEEIAMPKYGDDEVLVKVPETAQRGSQVTDASRIPSNSGARPLRRSE